MITFSVVRRVASLSHLQRPVDECSHGVDPGLRGGVDEAAVDPGADLVFLKVKH